MKRTWTIIGVADVPCVCRKPRPLDLVRESLNVGRDGRVDLPRLELGCLALKPRWRLKQRMPRKAAADRASAEGTRMPVADQPLAAVLRQRVSMTGEQGCNLGLDRLRQQRS
jgi:hypothetical protein